VCCCLAAWKVDNRCRSFALFYPLQNWNCNKFSAWKFDNRHSFALFSPLQTEIATNSDFSNFPVCCCTTAWKVDNRCRRFALLYPLQNWNCNKFWHFPLFGSVGVQAHEKLITDTVSHNSIHCELKLQQILTFPTFLCVIVEPHEKLVTDVAFRPFLSIAKLKLQQILIFPSFRVWVH